MRTGLGGVVAFGVVVVLAGCASGPARSPVDGMRAGAASASPDRDGPEARPPANLAQVPDAEPRIETVRPGGANKPYQALGRDYVPITGDPPFSERGLASWYGRKFQGRRTASGEPYDMYAMTAAHPTLPIPSYARIRNPANGREVVVRINDRGPFHSGRIVDLSYTAALKLDVLRGVAPVELERITYEEVRTGAWRHGAPVEARVAGAPQPAGAPPPAVAVPVAVPAPLQIPPTPLPPPGFAGWPLAPSPGEAASGEPSGEAVGAVAAALNMPSAGFYVQLGAFRERDGAEMFQRRVLADADWLAPVLGLFGDAAYYRLQAGPYRSRVEAARAADRMRGDLQLVPVIVERR